MNVPTLKNIVSTLGDNVGGLIVLQYCPIEWLAADIVVNPTTRTVLQPILLYPGYKMLQLRCQSETLRYKEQPKTGTSGPYFITDISGTVNLDEADKNLQLDTLRFHRLLVLCYDKNGRRKLVGNRETGMSLAPECTIEPDAAGKSWFDVQLEYEAEHMAPFYEAP